MLISEIYTSNQGEGLLTGTPSVFVRFSGCNLRCDFCDTPFASWNPEGKNLDVAEVIHETLKLEIEHIVITGGEPMMFKPLADVCHALRENGKHITIETAGTLWQNLECDLMSISPKMKNSTPSLERAGRWSMRHEQTRHRPEIVQQLIQEYSWQLKFVVDRQEDLIELQQYLENLEKVERARILLMPQGVEVGELEKRKRWLEPYCDEHGYRFCDRMHIHWYGNERGT